MHSANASPELLCSVAAMSRVADPGVGSRIRAMIKA